MPRPDDGIIIVILDAASAPAAEDSARPSAARAEASPARPALLAHLAKAAAAELSDEA